MRLALPLGDDDRMPTHSPLYGVGIVVDGRL